MPSVGFRRDDAFRQAPKKRFEVESRPRVPHKGKTEDLSLDIHYFTVIIPGNVCTAWASGHHGVLVVLPGLGTSQLWLDSSNELVDSEGEGSRLGTPAKSKLGITCTRWKRRLVGELLA